MFRPRRAIIASSQTNPPGVELVRVSVGRLCTEGSSAEPEDRVRQSLQRGLWRLRWPDLAFTALTDTRFYGLNIQTFRACASAPVVPPCTALMNMSIWSRCGNRPRTALFIANGAGWKRSREG